MYFSSQPLCNCSLNSMCDSELSNARKSGTMPYSECKNYALGALMNRPAFIYQCHAVGPAKNGPFVPLAG